MINLDRHSIPIASRHFLLYLQVFTFRVSLVHFWYSTARTSWTTDVSSTPQITCTRWPTITRDTSQYRQSLDNGRTRFTQLRGKKIYFKKKSNLEIFLAFFSSFGHQKSFQSKSIPLSHRKSNFGPTRDFDTHPQQVKCQWLTINLKY